jgi:hypothetical protein
VTAIVARLYQACVRLYRAWAKTQTPVVLPLALIAVGITCLILGEDASKAFSDLSGGGVIRAMGLFMVTGGVLVITSILKNNYAREVLGLTLAALGAAIYGGGVILGLHNQGLVSGIGYAGITVTLLGRVYFLLQEGHKQEQERDRAAQ